MMPDITGNGGASYQSGRFLGGLIQLSPTITAVGDKSVTRQLLRMKSISLMVCHTLVMCSAYSEFWLF
jgi:hypothetical protein